MIPKIAHFHWTGPPMSWLRLMSIATFKRHNPGWEIRLHDTPPDIAARAPMFPQQADWTWWRVLARDGGLQVATDIIFVRPIPQAWLEADIVACKNNHQHIYHNAAIGAVPGHPFVQACERRCEEMGGTTHGDFQVYGPTMLTGMGLPEAMFDQPMAAFCSRTFGEAQKFWAIDGPPPGPDVIGLHWYGGDEHSRKHEPLAGPQSQYHIVKLALEAMK